jgi:serine/threonine protein phosphatase PrpC
VIHDGKLFVANAGDSEALLCKRYVFDACYNSCSRSPRPLSNPTLYRTTDGKIESVVLTEKHLATNEMLDGAVFSGRVFGALAVSRSLGDRDYKIPTSEANFVSSEPFTSQVTLTAEDQFLLLACDGLWEKVCL